MRFVLAIVALVIAIGLAGYGVAQRTILNGANNVTADVQTTSDAAVTVIDGATLNSLDGRQNVTLSGTDAIFAAYARTDDVLAWIGDTTYNEIGFDVATRELTSRTQTGAEAVVPSPVGSDLWLREYTGENQLEMPVVLDEDLSIIVVSDGTAAAPSEVSIRWPVDNRTPWAGPLIALGGLMLLVSLIFFVWALVHARRSRGPRRTSITGPKNPRGPKMPKLPRQRSYRVRKPRAISASRGRRSRRPMTAVIPTVIVVGVVLSGCSSDLWPDFGTSSASPSPAASESEAQVVDTVPPPVATVGQITAIVGEASTLAAETDASLDATALAARFAGPALEVRAGNYAIRAKDSAVAPLTAIPAGEDGALAVTLAQQRQADNSWPRTIFAVAQSKDPEKVPVALTLVQDAPRDSYKVVYAVDVLRGSGLPPLPPAAVGATLYGLDTKLLSTPPSEVLAAYLDIVNLGAASTFAPLFSLEGDPFLTEFGSDARVKRKEPFGPTVSYEYSNAPGASSLIALSSDETGAIVMASATETEIVKPTQPGELLNTQGQIKTLSGVVSTLKGTTSIYSDQFFFYVPPVTSSEKIVLLGFSSGLVSAKEIP